MPMGAGERINQLALSLPEGIGRLRDAFDEQFRAPQGRLVSVSES